MKRRPVPDQQRFRNQATGIGQTRSASERTGAARSQAVIDAAPKRQRRFAVGYPDPTPQEFTLCEPGQVLRQKTLR
ncbi:MAG: hypothetical protein KF863_21460 [Rubrivivax sp.]|nr:hypothetical protein [Rubrivivax sp.]